MSKGGDYRVLTNVSLFMNSVLISHYKKTINVWAIDSIAEARWRELARTLHRPL